MITNCEGEEAKLKIQGEADRDDLILVLANNGYFCKVEKVEIDRDIINGDNYYVVFKL